MYSAVEIMLGSDIIYLHNRVWGRGLVGLYIANGWGFKSASGPWFSSSLSHCRSFTKVKSWEWVEFNQSAGYVIGKASCWTVTVTFTPFCDMKHRVLCYSYGRGTGSTCLHDIKHLQNRVLFYSSIRGAGRPCVQDIQPTHAAMLCTGRESGRK
jgi:hypothetical protein